jgi:hypothetical protein
LKKNPTKLCFAIGAVMLLLYLSACKDPVVTDVGNTLNFQNISLLHADTCSVQFNTVPDRQLVSSGAATGALGSMNDLFFGTTYAGIYAQCLLSSNGSISGFAGYYLDSAVLIMPYYSLSSKFGRCDKPVDILVYQLSQDMIPGDNYYVNDAFQVYPQPIGTRYNFVPDLGDSVQFLDPTQSPVPYSEQSPMLRVRLSKSFAQQLFNTPDTTLQASLSFIEYFKGLYITTNPAKVGDGLMYFNLSNNSCNINLYYHEINSGYVDTAVYQFQINNYGVTINHWDHYYGNTLVEKALSNPNPNGDKVGYVQSGGGTKLRLRFPTLKNLPQNIGITKAEFIMPILDTLLADPNYPPPPSLNLYRIDDTLALQTLNSYNYSGVGTLTSRQDANNQSYLCYVFNLTEYVQRVLNGYYSNNNGYYVGFSYTTRGERAIILNDRSDPTKLSKYCQLKITYTKLQ